jgi:nitroreductase
VAHPQLELSTDQLLTTTRAVRKRLDTSRSVGMDVIRECLELAVQAPTGSNAQGWHFLVVTDASQRSRLAELYRRAFEVYRGMPVAAHAMHQDSPDAKLRASQQRVVDSAEYLSEHLHEVPAFLIPCLEGRVDAVPAGMGALAQGSAYASIIPATWSFMLAARARGLGTAWTTLHLMHEKEAAEILGIPFDEVTQVALIPLAYTRGTDFKPAHRKPLDGVLHVDRW